MLRGCNAELYADADYVACDKLPAQWGNLQVLAHEVTLIWFYGTEIMMVNEEDENYIVELYFMMKENDLF